MNLYEAMKHRRTHYNLSAASTISDARIEEILKDALTYTPSAFHSQSARAVLLLGESHQQLWQIVMDALRARVPAEKFAPTEKKIQGFAAAYATILYFEDMETVDALQKNFAQYADNFPVWSSQSAGMLQYAVWTALSQEGLGASLQHYNPIIDEQVRVAFGVPSGWKLLAQMPFGVPTTTPRELERLPIERRIKILGGNT